MEPEQPDTTQPNELSEPNDDGGRDHRRVVRDPPPSAVFYTVTALTLIALSLHVLIAIIGSDSEQVKSAAEATSTTYKMGFGAIVGLLGRRN